MENESRSFTELEQATPSSVGHPLLDNGDEPGRASQNSSEPGRARRGRSQECPWADFMAFSLKTGNPSDERGRLR